MTDIILTIIPRPFGGFDLYYEGELVSIVRPYMNSWTFTFEGEEQFVCPYYEAEEDLSQNTAEKCIEQVQMLIQRKRDEEERRKYFERLIFGD